MGKMEDIIEETPIETYKHGSENLDIYGCIEDMAKYPEKANSRLKTIEDILKRLKDQQSLTDLVKGNCNSREKHIIIC